MQKNIDARKAEQSERTLPSRRHARQINRGSDQSQRGLLWMPDEARPFPSAHYAHRMPRKSTPQSGATRGTVFQQVARVRLEDGAVLLENERYSGAIYLAGYALECLLKWAVTERRQCVYLPLELETHDLAELLAQSGLKRTLMRDHDLSAKFDRLAESWGPELRYLAKEPTAKSANQLYQQIALVYHWIVEQRI